MKTMKLTKAIAAIAIAAAMSAGCVASAQASTATTVAVKAAEASDVPTVITLGSTTASCSAGRCWILFNKAETAALGRGSVPNPPAWVPGQIKIAYYVTAYAHRFIAADYARKGLCSAFILSIYPWEGRGYKSFAC